jgi:hypothetical protein
VFNDAMFVQLTVILQLLLLLLQCPTHTACRTASRAHTAPMQGPLAVTQEVTQAWTHMATHSCRMQGLLALKAWPSCLSVSWVVVPFVYVAVRGWWWGWLPPV